MMICSPVLVAILLLTSEAFTVTQHHHHQRRRRAQTILLAKKGKKTSRYGSAGKGFGGGKSLLTSKIDSQSPVTHTKSETHATLIKWLQENPITYISPKFMIKQSGLGGYGGFASASISDGELIFRIPRECCVTQQDAFTSTSCGEIFQLAREKNVPSYQMLILSGFIAKEYLRGKRMKDKTLIKHWPYLQSIPWSQGDLEQEHVIFWSAEKVERLLRKSKAYNDASMIRKTVDSAMRLMKDVIQPIVEDADEIEIEEAIKGAFVICLSRSFAEEVESDDGTTIEIENALLPLLDVLQHSGNPNTSLESYDDFILLRARGVISSGEELFHCYQEEIDDIIPKYKFFTRYGFIPGVRTPVLKLLESEDPIFF